RNYIYVTSLAFSPDGRTLVTGGTDHVVRRWAVPDGKPVGGPLLHPASVDGVWFAPGGRVLATSQEGGLVRLWALPTPGPHDYDVPLDSSSFARFSRDGRTLLPTGRAQRSCDLRATRVYD